LITSKPFHTAERQPGTASQINTCVYQLWQATSKSCFQGNTNINDYDQEQQTHSNCLWANILPIGNKINSLEAIPAIGTSKLFILAKVQAIPVHKRYFDNAIHKLTLYFTLHYW